MKRVLVLFFCNCIILLSGQIGPYSWQDHLSLSTCITVARFNGKIYASNYNGLVAIDEEEESTRRLNKINGLSDVGITLLRVNPYNNKLLVIYENSNIDIIDADGNIKNYPDIFLKTINGNKVISDVYFKDNYAYLACGLGIIVFDTEKLEIKDTYIIGPGGNNLQVYQVAMNDSLIFAATPNGLMKSNYKLKVLNNFNSWIIEPSLPAGIYGGVTRVGTKIMAAYSPSKASPGTTSDTLYILKNNVWSRYLGPTGNLISRLYNINDTLYGALSQFGIVVTQVDTKVTQVYFANVNGKSPNQPNDVIFFKDHTGGLSYWVADKYWGLYQAYGSYPFGEQTIKPINGTHRSWVTQMDVNEGVIAVAPSHINEDGSQSYMAEGVNIYKDNTWSIVPSLDFNQNPILDINCVLLDRKDKSTMWASAWGLGLLQYKDNQLVAVYNSSNSPMGAATPNDVGSRSSGLSMDKDGNLWIAVSDQKEFLVVRMKDGTFKSFNFGTPHFTRTILVDKNNFVWALHERDEGITVYNPGSNYDPPVEGVNFRRLTKDVNFGNLESNTVFSIAEDKDGKIWVGTAAGVHVFYNPSNMFSGSNYDAQPIKIVQDGNVELLLEKESVTAIMVDGANNKWMGTASGGLYCFSPDGLTQLYHFTKATSPLYSDFIFALNYNKTTGDIFIGTDLGVQTFRSPIVEGEDNLNNVYAYPNPVKPGYNGNVFVRGLMDNSVVKITDESGNLVWETKSTGGQIEWPVKNLSGARAATGVYIVYAATTTGEIKSLAKVLVVN
jgi:sugar lactone lactonase YvrE